MRPTRLSVIETGMSPVSALVSFTEALAGTPYELLITRNNMSIIYCEKHHRHYDSDFDIDCLECEEECEYCGGTGEVATDEDDGEGHIMRGVGTEKCICQIEQ